MPFHHATSPNAVGTVNLQPSEAIITWWRIRISVVRKRKDSQCVHYEAARGCRFGDLNQMPPCLSAASGRAEGITASGYSSTTFKSRMRISSRFDPLTSAQILCAVSSVIPTMNRVELPFFLRYAVELSVFVHEKIIVYSDPQMTGMIFKQRSNFMAR